MHQRYEVEQKKSKETFGFFAMHHGPVNRELVRNFVVDLERSEVGRPAALRQLAGQNLFTNKN